MKIRFQKRALHQIDKALDYVRTRSPRGASRIEARLSEALSLIQTQPHIGIKLDVPGVRRFFLTPYPYLIDYFVGKEELVIQRFRHTARDPAGTPGRA